MSDKKIISIAFIGALTIGGWYYFKNVQGTSQIPTTIGSNESPGQYLTSYNFSDLFGSGQTSPQTLMPNAQTSTATLSPSTGASTGAVETAFKSGGSIAGINSYGMAVSKNQFGTYSPVDTSTGKLAPMSTLPPTAINQDALNKATAGKTYLGGGWYG